MMNKTNYDVAIVGAGPAGSTAATALSQRGWDVLLLEQDNLPRHKVCGEFLSPEAQKSLVALGLYESVTALSPVSLHHAVVTSPRGQRVSVQLPVSAWGVSRFALDYALATAAQEQGTTVWTGVTVSNVMQTDDGYLLKLHNQANMAAPQRPAAVTARTLILACGRHSKLTMPSSNLQGKTQRRRRQQHVGVKCHFEGAAASEQIELFFFPGGYGGINPVEDGRANLCLLVTYQAFQAAGKSPTAMLDAVRERQPDLAQQLANARLLPETVRTVAAVDTAQPATPWQGAACIGDAAAMITPLCGDGMAMAMRSAELCAPLADAFLRGQISQAEWAQRLLPRLAQRLWSSPRRRAPTPRCTGDASVGRPIDWCRRFAPPLTSHLFAATRGPYGSCSLKNAILMHVCHPCSSAMRLLTSTYAGSAPHRAMSRPSTLHGGPLTHSPDNQ